MRARIGALVIALLLGSTAVAEGQDRAAAERAFAEAERQFRAGNHQLALDGLQETSRLLEGDRRAQTLLLYNIGRTQEQLGRYPEALASFERFLAEAPSDAPSREEALDHARDLRARIAAESAPDSGGSPLLPAGIAVAGVGALALLAAIPTGVLTLDGTAQLEATCDASGCPPSAEGLVSDTRSLSIATDVLWIAGLGVAALGATLLGVALANESSQTTASIACTEDGCVAMARFALE